MGALVKTLYETDYLEWAEQTAQLIRERRFDEIDIENLAEEVEYLAGSERSALKSQLRRLLMHLIKQRIQPGCDGACWRTSILSAQLEIRDHIQDSPSLRPYAQRVLHAVYRDAVKLALAETGLEETAAELNLSEQCPFTLDQLFADDIAALWRQ